MFGDKRQDIEITLKRQTGITEANIRKEDKPEDLEIDRYKLITGRGIDKSGGISRTAILVRKDINYKVIAKSMRLRSCAFLLVVNAGKLGPHDRSQAHFTAATRSDNTG